MGPDSASETPREYIDGRLGQSLAWHGAAATRSRRLFLGSVTAGAALATLVLVLVAFDVPTEFIALAGALSALASTPAASVGWWDNWVRCRFTAEDLLRERWLFGTRSGPYRQLTDEAAFDELVRTVEDLLLEERRQWRTARNRADQASSPPDESRAAASWPRGRERALGSPS